jgi:hypothetical protein
MDRLTGCAGSSRFGTAVRSLSITLSAPAEATSDDPLARLPTIGFRRDELADALAAPRKERDHPGHRCVQSPEQVLVKHHRSVSPESPGVHFAALL